jgi:hypothetical protein
MGGEWNSNQLGYIDTSLQLITMHEIEYLLLLIAKTIIRTKFTMKTTVSSQYG